MELLSDLGNKARFAKVFTADQLKLTDNYNIIGNGSTSLHYKLLNGDLYLIDEAHPDDLSFATRLASGVSHIYKDSINNKLLLLRKNGRVIPDVSSYDYFELPKGYTRLEYIESSSSGNRIDTGVSGGINSLTIEGEVYYKSFSKYSALWGNWVDDSSNCWRLIFNSSDNNSFLMNSNTKGGGGGTNITGGAKNSWHSFKATRNSSKQSFIFDGKSFEGNLSNGSANAGNIVLFAAGPKSTGANLGTRFSWFKIYDGDELVCDLIPARTSAGALGMFDRITETFKTNQGTGSLVAGPQIIQLQAEGHEYQLHGNMLYKDGVFMLPGIATLKTDSITGKPMVSRISNPTVLLDPNTIDYQAVPEGYVKLKYLEEGTGGGCMIDTGIAGNNTLVIEGEIYYSKWTKYATLAFGNYVDETSNVWRIIFNSTDNNTFLPYANSQAGAAKYTLSGGKKSDWHNFKIWREGSTQFCTWDGKDNSGGIANKTDNITNIALFSSAVTNKSIAYIGRRIAWFKISDEGELRRDFIPVKTSDGALGMYDYVTQQLFTNRGSGAFVAGPDID